MGKVAIKCVDGMVYTGDLVRDTDNFIILKTLDYRNGNIQTNVPNLKNAGTYYTDEVKFYKNNIIWISYQ